MNHRDVTVLVFGTFDVIHPGHKWFLQQAGKLGGRLVAAVARDNFIKEWKGHAPVLDETRRMEALEESGYVASAILSDEDIRTYGVVLIAKPDVICLGHDQKALKDDLESWLSAHSDIVPEIIVLAPWKRSQYSSTRRNRVLKGAVPEEGSTPWGLYLLMIVAMGTFGFSWVSGKRIAGYATPSTLAFIRFAITALCFVPVVLIKSPKTSMKGTGTGWLWTAAGAAALSIYNLLFFSGLNAGLAGQGGLIVTTLNPLFTFLLVAAGNRKSPQGRNISGVLIGIIGGILLMQPWRYSAGNILDSGNAAFLGAAFSWSILTVISRRAQLHLGFRKFNIGLYTIAALMMLPFSYISGGASPFASIPSNSAFWADMLFISAATGAFGTGVYFMVSSRLGAARGSAFTYLVPIFALLFTSLILFEKPDLPMITGGILAIVAVTLINRKR